MSGIVPSKVDSLVSVRIMVLRVTQLHEITQDKKSKSHSKISGVAGTAEAWSVECLLSKALTRDSLMKARLVCIGRKIWVWWTLERLKWFNYQAEWLVSWTRNAVAQGPAVSGKGVYVIMTGPWNSNQPAMEIKRQLQEKTNSIADLPGSLILDHSTVRNERVLRRAPRLW